ncbi:hypothetical protein BX257_3880 [Streptomyces sp. 3212.3]|nr:hypothetical protein BX257_3880 [Streptomyces sp. 3212.3]
MAWALGPLVTIFAALSLYGALRLISDFHKRRKPYVKSHIRQSGGVSPETLLRNAYWQALEAVDDHAWLATQEAVNPDDLGALQKRWEALANQPSPEHRIEPSPRVHERSSGERFWSHDRGAPPAVADLLAQARAGLDDAASMTSPNRRYATAHLAALRAAAAVLAARGRPEPRQQRRARIRSAWEVLPEVAPELKEWSALFASGAPRRARAEAGIPGAASQRDADDLLRESAMFVRLIERILVLAPQSPAPDLMELTENQDTGEAVRQLGHSFDELFRTLGPPPPGVKQQEPVPGGGGGTAR